MRASKKTRILYLQFTNPAGYPALGHSSRILAERGWEVSFLGIGALGTQKLAFPPHPRIRIRRLPFSSAAYGQKLLYLAFILVAVWRSLRWRPHWIYASDPLSCPLGLALSYVPGLRVIYHEHDSPVQQRPNSNRARAFCQTLTTKSRQQLARRAWCSVLPNENRAERFRRSTGTERSVLCVWNCPSRDEALEGRVESSQTILHYHGNVGPELVPTTVIKALAFVPGVQFRVIGYSTLGQENYPAMLRIEAQRHGVSDRVQIQPAVPRAALLAEARKASIGLALMPMVSSNENFRDMVGASNKPFDYLACGVPLLVSDLPEWRATFVDSRFGLACDPSDPMSIATALRWYIEHKSEGRSMGESGRQKILAEWNYETYFGQAVRRITSHTL